MFEIKIEQITASEKENSGSFLQTPFWCQFKARHGWSYRRFLVSTQLNEVDSTGTEEKNCNNNQKQKDAIIEKSRKTFELAVLNRNFAKGLFSIAYIPLMPELPFELSDSNLIDEKLDNDEKEVVLQEMVTPETQAIEFTHLLYDLGKALKAYLPKNTIAIRFDPAVGFDTPEERDAYNFGIKTVAFADKLKLKKNKVDIQPPDSTLVSLEGTEDEIMQKMHAKWRYNIRLSEKKGVVVKKYLGNDPKIAEKIDKFYELTKETNARDGNSCHAKSYYLDLIQSSQEQISKGKDVPQINLYIAESEGEEIASIMTLNSHTESIYLYGASSNKKRNLMPNHLLQWTAMKDAKEYGSMYYDMYGMPPEGKDENHPMHGLYMFKANFGGKNIHRIGSWDVPLKAAYNPYKAAESLRAFWHKKVIKKLKGR